MKPEEAIALEFYEESESVTAYQKLFNRYNYFSIFSDYEREDACRVLIDPSYTSVKARALDVLQALNLQPMISHVSSCNTSEHLILIELNNDYDFLFIGEENRVYQEIVTHFQEMTFCDDNFENDGLMN